MSSGKTTLGPTLAVKLGIPFFDLDKEIEKLEHKSPAAIFQAAGEDQFRAIEKITLNTFIKTHLDFVLATGGGTPCYSNNMEVMKKSGLTIFLNVGVKELVRRNLNSTGLRPLLHGMNELQMQAFITEHLKQRLPHYKKASLTLKEDDNDLERLIQEIRLMTHSR